MKHLWKAAVLFVTINAILYGTNVVWDSGSFTGEIQKIQRATIQEQQGSSM